jgi:hypothetical protein
MRIARSTFYAGRPAPDDTAIVEAIAAICGAFAPNSVIVA